MLLDDRFLHAKVCDFGIAKRIGNPSSQGSREQEPLGSHTTGVGTYRYMAPEVHLGAEYSFLCDVYSFGMLLWELTHDKVVFEGFNGRKLTQYVSSRVVHDGKRPPLALPPGLTDIGPLITSCWHGDPADRPTMKACAEELNQLVSSPSGSSAPTASRSEPHAASSSSATRSSSPQPPTSSSTPKPPTSSSFDPRASSSSSTPKPLQDELRKVESSSTSGSSPAGYSANSKVAAGAMPPPGGPSSSSPTPPWIIQLEPQL